MHAGIRKLLGMTLAATAVFLGQSGLSTARGDEPGLFGRLFRLGAPPASSPRDPAPAARPSQPPADLGAPPPGFGGAAPNVPTPSLLPPAGGLPATPPAADDGQVQRIRPQPRVSRAATEADPILTRVALGRADDGNQFGMFLQIYADGTVIDGEGVHRVAPDALKPLVQLLQSGELTRAVGHCGGPPTDFIEQVHVVAYERRLGGLRANSFSYSGNPAGCDPAIRQLHQVLEQLQSRLSSPGGVVDAAPAVVGSPFDAGGTAPLPPFAPSSTASSLSLTPAIR